jgi:hypothetical protein
MPKLKSIIARPRITGHSAGTSGGGSERVASQHALHLRDVVSREQLTHAAIAKKPGVRAPESPPS